MRTGFVVAPGIDGSDAEHWQSRWQRGWGDAAVRTRPLSWERPDLADWVGAVERAVAALPQGTGRVVLVAHSLGCWASAEWSRLHPDDDRVRLFLVAPPDPATPAFPRVEAPTFAGLVPRRVAHPGLVVASLDDPYGDEHSSRRLADGWGLPWVDADARGHLNSDSGLGDWARGRELLDGLLDDVDGGA